MQKTCPLLEGSRAREGVLRPHKTRRLPPKASPLVSVSGLPAAAASVLSAESVAARPAPASPGRPGGAAHSPGWPPPPPGSWLPARTGPVPTANTKLMNRCLHMVRCLGLGGFFLAYKDLGRMFDDSFSACAFFFFFFFEMEISSCTLIPLFGQDQSAVAPRAEMTVDVRSLTSCE